MSLTSWGPCFLLSMLELGRAVASRGASTQRASRSVLRPPGSLGSSGKWGVSGVHKEPLSGQKGTTPLSRPGHVAPRQGEAAFRFPVRGVVSSPPSTLPCPGHERPPPHLEWAGPGRVADPALSRLCPCCPLSSGTVAHLGPAGAGTEPTPRVDEYSLDPHELVCGDVSSMLGAQTTPASEPWSVQEREEILADREAPTWAPQGKEVLWSQVDSLSKGSGVRSRPGPRSVGRGYSPWWGRHPLGLGERGMLGWGALKGKGVDVRKGESLVFLSLK